MCFCLGKNTIYSKYSTNNNFTQIDVKGVKQIQTFISESVRVYDDGSAFIVRFGGSFTIGSSGNFTCGTITSSKSPVGQVMVQIGVNNWKVVVGTDKSIKLEGNSTTANVYTTVYVPYL